MICLRLRETITDIFMTFTSFCEGNSVNFRLKLTIRISIHCKSRPRQTCEIKIPLKEPQRFQVKPIRCFVNQQKRSVYSSPYPSCKLVSSNLGFKLVSILIFDYHLRVNCEFGAFGSWQYFKVENMVNMCNSLMICSVRFVLYLITVAIITISSC